MFSSRGTACVSLARPWRQAGAEGGRGDLGAAVREKPVADDLSLWLALPAKSLSMQFMVSVLVSLIRLFISLCCLLPIVYQAILLYHFTID